MLRIFERKGFLNISALAKYGLKIPFQRKDGKGVHKGILVVGAKIRVALSGSFSIPTISVLKYSLKKKFSWHLSNHMPETIAQLISVKRHCVGVYNC